VHLSDEMREELERRLALIASEQAGDPAFRDLPLLDVIALLAFVGLAVLVTLLLQAS
jgi:hypothetical protein